jgi:hypothetical protein
MRKPVSSPPLYPWVSVSRESPTRDKELFSHLRDIQVTMKGNAYIEFTKDSGVPVVWLLSTRPVANPCDIRRWVTRFSERFAKAFAGGCSFPETDDPEKARTP